MTDASGRKRSPRGTPTGGQFAVENRGESDIELSDDIQDDHLPSPKDVPPYLRSIAKQQAEVSKEFRTKRRWLKRWGDEEKYPDYLRNAVYDRLKRFPPTKTQIERESVIDMRCGVIRSDMDLDFTDEGGLDDTIQTWASKGNCIYYAMVYSYRTGGRKMVSLSKSGSGPEPEFQHMVALREDGRVVDASGVHDLEDVKSAWGCDVSTQIDLNDAPSESHELGDGSNIDFYYDQLAYAMCRWHQENSHLD